MSIEVKWDRGKHIGLDPRCQRDVCLNYLYIRNTFYRFYERIMPINSAIT